MSCLSCRSSLHRLVAGVGVAALLALATPHAALANDPIAEPVAPAATGRVPLLPRHSADGIKAAVGPKRGAHAVAPPPPAAAPQVGPVIKRYYADEIDRRTTAFLPAGLDQYELTPIDMPETDEPWVRVDLSEQLLVAYRGARPVRAFVISSGLPKTPTVTGTFHVRAKVRSQLMDGGDPALGNDYYLPNVEWVQYFFEDYAFHGTYWHNSFGSPRSHGCINMTNADAKWLWEFLGPEWNGVNYWMNSTTDNPGSLVIVHE